MAAQLWICSWQRDLRPCQWPGSPPPLPGKGCAAGQHHCRHGQAPGAGHTPQRTLASRLFSAHVLTRERAIPRVTPSDGHVWLGWATIKPRGRASPTAFLQLSSLSVGQSRAAQQLGHVLRSASLGGSATVRTSQGAVTTARAPGLQGAAYGSWAAGPRGATGGNATGSHRAPGKTPPSEARQARGAHAAAAGAMRHALSQHALFFTSGKSTL